ncbi:Acetyltransferase (GNAT) family protein [Nocardioides dokdonensis FR1436]|uniref:Acetyltransferase (GNAT) family protein n=1 Tax=Nocardioides dokdonensis FR1436 TaxID=1300347 RepID=A0A1A9GKX6_9ACTN|nr:GNAT family N-acetyltransferase [Nocardioides dokdonensis]ANH38105.1 Acetyltransferase (GNAT) family protein [Nocardioides dokdonensis FR1436]
MIPEENLPDENRFESDPGEIFDDLPLPDGWEVGTPDADDPAEVARLTHLLRAHERHGRGWAGAGVDDVLVEVSEHGLRTRENVVIRDPEGQIEAWGSVHDRAGGRMLYSHIVSRELGAPIARKCSDALFEWATAQARAVGEARGLPTQQIDTGAFEDDGRQAEWLTRAGFRKVRTWWQMNRPVTPEEVDLVPDNEEWEARGVRFRLVDREGQGLPDEADLRAVHDVLEQSFNDHFNNFEESYAEFLHRLREDPGHRWNHWWLAEMFDDVPEGLTAEEGRHPAVGALIGTFSENATGPDSSYVSYIGVIEAARGRGVAKGLLRTIISDAARRGRIGVGLEVDADSATNADGLYTSMGWRTKYVTQSWHRDVPVEG